MAKTRPVKNGVSELSYQNSIIWAKVLLAVLLVLVVGVLMASKWTVGKNGDTAVYTFYSHAIWGGAIPYRDIPIQYPPGVLPFILLAQPIGAAMGGYLAGFAALTVLALMFVFRWIYDRYGAKGMALSALVLLPLGEFFFFELDIFSSIALCGSLLLLAQRKFRLAAVLLAVAVVIKGYPLVCLPIFLVSIPKTKLKAFIASFTGFIAACLASFTLISPSGFWNSFSYQLIRPPQIESGIAAIGFAAHVLGQPINVFISHKAYAVTLPGSVKSFISYDTYAVAFHGSGFLTSAATLLAVTSIVWLAYRLYKTKTKDNPALGCFIALLIFAMLFKVGSPQYLVPVWLTGAMAAWKFSGRDRLELALRLLVIGIVVYATFSNYRQLTHRESYATALIIIRYILIADLLLWGTRKLRKPQSTPAQG